MDILTADVLPNSIPKTTRNVVVGKWGIFWKPIYCASCGKDGGRVPEEYCHFAFYQCDDCYAKYGLVAGTMVEPDRVFWERVNNEMIEKYGRILSPPELQGVIDAKSTPLASLFQDGATTKGRS